MESSWPQILTAFINVIASGLLARVKFLDSVNAASDTEGVLSVYKQGVRVKSSGDRSLPRNKITIPFAGYFLDYDSRPFFTLILAKSLIDTCDRNPRLFLKSIRDQSGYGQS